MKKIFIIIFSGLFGIAAMAQSENVMMNKNRMIIPTFNNTPETFTGSPYFEEEFKKGVINDGEGRTQDAYLRYNAVEEEMEIKLEKVDEQFMVLPKLKKITYSIDEKKYFIATYRTEKGEKLQGYFVSFYDGEEVKLLGWHRPDIIEAQKARTGYEKNKPAHLKVDLEYYISKNDGRLQEVKMKPRNFRKLFNDSRAMKKYLSDNKVKSTEEAIEALKYFENQA